MAYFSFFCFQFLVGNIAIRWLRYCMCISCHIFLSTCGRCYSLRPFHSYHCSDVNILNCRTCHLTLSISTIVPLLEGPRDRMRECAMRQYTATLTIPYINARNAPINFKSGIFFLNKVSLVNFVIISASELSSTHIHFIVHQALTHAHT